jgi:hypothetical protein
MKTSTAYKILVEKELIIEYYTGEVRAHDFISLKERICKEPDYDFSFDTIIDIRDAALAIDENDLSNILAFINIKFKDAAGRKSAYLTASPNDVVQTTMYASLNEINNKLHMQMGTFSTVKAVSKWFGYNGTTTDLIESTIAQLKEKVK